MEAPNIDLDSDSRESQHEPLEHPELSIRLVQTLPHFSSDNLVQCEISHRVLLEAASKEDPTSTNAPLDRIGNDDLDSISYVCLSYTWGDPRDQTLIRISGKLVRVGRNLADFLSIARRALIDTSIWVDALRINQRDTSERNKRVQQMGKIYAGAAAILIWLGNDLEVAQVLHSVNEASKRSYISWNAPVRSWRSHMLHNWTARCLYGNDAIDATLHAASGSSSSAAARYSDVAAFVTSEAPSILSDTTGKVEKLFEPLFQNEYWSRAWVTQEVLLAKDAVVVAGVASHGLLALANKYRSAVPYFRENSFENLVDILLRRVGRRASNDTGLEKWGIVNLLYRFRDKNCAVRRDRVYSLLALSKEGETLAVDYDASHEQLLRQVLRTRECSMCLCSTAIVAHTLSPWNFTPIETEHFEPPFAELHMWKGRRRENKLDLRTVAAEQ
ncbi:hypothetical protein EK21DRAFT_90773 [Setomelanomma holmii]|uniref:Heterokaryon incompatibility domain-containing protein n=1 Tax=Setomelanomma holmii TaxID=210430 RepID=A0A9P4H772_9PLEO|nr:hypothetical protein EK21DRAFT_90773 [Setomelanomma holmii]